MEELLILVDQHDQAIGTGAKMAVHRDGLLHRAFSIFVFDNSGRLLLQQRAAGKNHSGNRWSNTCCGHPRYGESIEVAAHRRLSEEMGFHCRLQEVAALTYHLPMSNQLIEHEYNHIFAGVFNGEPAPDPAEAADWSWIEGPALRTATETAAATFTAWFIAILNAFGPDCLDLWKLQAQK